MKIKANQLSGAALDWAVAICEGFHKDTPRFMELFSNMNRKGQGYCWSTSWADGGPIIEREIIMLDYDAAHNWEARDFDSQLILAHGPTPLIAAMRCYVASKLGDEIDVPDTLAP